MIVTLVAGPMASPPPRNAEPPVTRTWSSVRIALVPTLMLPPSPSVEGVLPPVSVTWLIVTGSEAAVMLKMRDSPLLWIVVVAALSPVIVTWLLTVNCPAETT